MYKVFNSWIDLSTIFHLSSAAEFWLLFSKCAAGGSQSIYTDASEITIAPIGKEVIAPQSPKTLNKYISVADILKFLMRIVEAENCLVIIAFWLSLV